MDLLCTTGEFITDYIPWKGQELTPISTAVRNILVLGTPVSLGSLVVPVLCWPRLYMWRRN